MRVESFMLPIIRTAAQRPWLSNLMFRRDPWGNPFDPDLVAKPYIYVERMWADGPIVYRKAFRRWFILGYEECQYLANHPGASAGLQIDDFFTDVRPYSRLAPETKDFFRDWMLLRDGDHHARLRNLVSRTFTPRRIAGLEPLIQTAVDDLIDAMGDRSSIEMFAEFNRPLPVNVICMLLGIPAERAEWIGEVVADISTFLDPTSNFSVDRVDDAHRRFREYILDLAHERLVSPQDDLITALAQAEDGDDRLTEDELVANAGLLVFAGHDTTAHMLGNALVALAEHPDQRALVRGKPDLWPNAVEELLRFDSTLIATARQLTEDITIGDVTIPSGAAVSLHLVGANRDRRRYDRPELLQLDRENPRPLSFGHGIHHCLGHSLARTELRIALSSIVERFGDFTIDPDGIDWRLSTTLRGPTRLELTRP